MGDYAGLTVQGANRYDNLGRTVADAGDINGDGIGDFIVSAPYADEFGEVYSFSGSAYVVFGSADGPADLSVDALDGTNGFRIVAEGARSGDDSPGYADYYAIGTFADGIGDINGDGIDDIVVAGRTGRYYYETQYARPNFVYVIFGRDAAVDGDFDATVNVADLGQPDAADGFQITGVDGIVSEVASAGDVNGDGLGDLLISQSPLTANNYGGYYGYYQAAALTIDPNADPATDPEVGFQGFVLFGADGIGAFGAVDVADLDGSNGFRVLTERSDINRGYFGEGGFYNSELGAISSIGDVNGDGFSDIAVRTIVAKYDSPYGGNYGTSVESRAYILFGKGTSGPGGQPFDANVDPSTAFDAIEVSWSSVSFNSYYSSGGVYDNISIRGIGDINGDGFDDVAVGNPNRTLVGYDAGQDAIGIVSVYFGGPLGVDFDLDRDTDNDGISDGLNVNGDPEPGNQFSADLIIVNSNDRFDFFGGAVVAAGDINGDGIGDFAIAAPRTYSFAETEARPSVFVIFGRDDVGVTPQVIDLDNLDQAAADQTGYRFITDDQSFFGDRGLSLSAAGDIDGDGVDDLLLGVPYAEVAGLPYGGRYAGEAYVVYGGLDALEAADNADGANDNVINVANLNVDVETGILPIEVSVRNAGQYSVFQNEGNAGPTVFAFEVQRTGDLQAAVSFDFAVTGFGVRPANAADFVGGVLPSGTVDFAAGEAIATVEIQIQGDEAIESHEDFRFAISNPETDSAAPITITADETFARIFNDDFPITFFAFNTDVVEGDPGDDRVLSFEVVRTGPGFAASVDFAITGGTANAADFEPGELPRSGTLNFAEGEFRKTVDFRIAEDLTTELNETLQLTLSNAQSAESVVQIGDPFAVGTIFTDDFPPQILVSGGGFVTEGTGPGFTPVTFTIERRGETDGVTEVTYDLNPLPAPGDFFAADSNDIEGFLPSFGNVVRFEDGETHKTVTVNIIRDGIIEPREDFELRVTEVQSFNGVTYDVLTPSARVTIANDDGRPPVIPPGIESDVFGDPHIITLDGLGYDFQAVGEYILVETEAGAANPFQVQVRFEPLPGSDLVSVTTRMAVEVNGHTIELDALGNDTLLIDGAAPDAAALALGAIDVDGDGTSDVFFNEALNEFTVVLNDENEQLFVKNMDGALNICVFLADSADGNAGNVRGLMGDGDGDGTADDLALRDGTVLAQPIDFDTIYGDYADSWRLDGSTSDKTALFSNTVTFPEGFPAAALTLDDLPADLRAAAEAAAIAAGLDPAEPEIFNAAVLDFALTGDSNFFAGALGLAAEPTVGTEPANAPALPATVGVTAGEGSIVEGDAGVQSTLFTFYRIGDTSGEVTVDYAIGGGVDAADLEAGTALTGQVTFAAGETSKSISIGVQGDLATEGDEKLTVSITGMSDPDALVGASQVSTLIETDDFAPEAADDAFSTDEDTTVAGNLFAANPTTIDDDADGDMLTVAGITTSAGQDRAANGGLIILPSGAHLRVEANGDFSFDPFGFAIGGGSEDDSLFDRLDDGEIATETFTYRVADGNGGIDTATVTINVRGVNDAPVAVVDSISLTEDDASAGVNVIAGNIAPDVDPEGGALKVTAISVGGTTVSVDAVTGATVDLTGGGRLEINQAGDATFFTEGAFEDLGDNAGQLVQRNINFIYTVEDEKGLTDTQLLQVFVGGVNDAPTAVDDVERFGVSESGSLFANLRENDLDAEGDDLTVVAANGLDAPFDLQEIVSTGGRAGLLSIFDTSDPTENDFLFDTDGAFEDLGAGESDTVSFAYTISDGELESTATVTFEVTGENDLAVFQSEDAFSITENTTAVGTVLATDVDANDEISYSIVTIGAPDDGELFEIDAETGALSFIAAPDFENPMAEEGGNVYHLRVAAFDGTEAVTQDITVTVTDLPENTPPVTMDDEYSTGFGDVLTVDAAAGVLANDFDPDGDGISVASSGQGALGVLNLAADGSFTYTPNAGASGVDTIAYTITDGGSFTPGEITITIDPNGPPVATDDSYSVRANTALTVNAALGLLDNDFDPDGNDLSVADFQPAANGTLDVTADGSFTYTPNAGFVGTETIEYTVTDGFDVDAATLTIDVTNIAPTAVDDDYETGFGEVLTVDVLDGVLGNDFDGDGDALSVFEFQQGALGTLNLAEDGSFTYTPNAGASGVDTIAYTVTDGVETDEGEISITIAEGSNAALIEGSAAQDRLIGTGADEIFRTFAGAADVAFSNGGADVFEFGAETSNGVRERDYIYGFDADDKLDLGGAVIVNEINAPTATLLQLSGDGDVIYLMGVSDFDENAQLVGVNVI